MYIAYSPEIKAKAINMHNAGKPVSAISKELGIAESTLHRWICYYTSPQSVTEEQAAKEIAKLAAECNHMQNVLKILYF